MTLEDLVSCPTSSTKSMWPEERRAGIAQMLDDLARLAREDGCIAAAWALEFIEELPCPAR